MSDNMSVQQAEAVIKTDEELLSELEIACWGGKLGTVKDLISRGANVHAIVDGLFRNDTLFHAACWGGHLDVVKYLLEDQQCDVNVTNKLGSTPLHYSCRGGHLDVVKYLLEDQQCDVNVTNNIGSTPLHHSCLNGNVDLVRYLAECHNCDVNVTNNVGDTPLHYSCRNGSVDLVKYLAECRNCDVNVTNNAGDTPLHYSCRYGHLDVMKYLAECHNCNVNVTNNAGDTPLHYSCRFGRLDIVKYLVECHNCDVNVTNNAGDTPLHYSCRSLNFSLELLEYLLNILKMDPNQITNSGKSPLQLITENTSYKIQGDLKQRAIRLLLAYGAKPPYESWNQYLKVNGPQKPAEAYSKLFLMGDPGGGKSTLAKSVETESEGLDRFLNWLRKVPNVDTKTAGIVTKDIVSKSLGRVTVYDLAGHSEFYASHDIALRNALAGSPSSIIVLVVDMRGGGKSFEAAVHKWCSFAENLYETSTDNLPFLIIVGSHEDTASKANVATCRQVISALQNSTTLTCFRFKGFVTLDCRYSESSHMSELRAILRECSLLLKQEELLSFREHCFLVSVLDSFRDVPAVTIKDVISKRLEFAESSSSHHSFLPTSAEAMVDICTQLNKRGNISFLANTESPENSWIVIQKDVLLKRVNGSIFAPKDFKEHTPIATDTGIIPVSKLASHFPDIDENLIVSFMCNLQYCLQVTDPEILQQLSISGDHLRNEKFLFFPSLVTIKAPIGVWEACADFTYQSAWLLQCHKPDLFFPSRFLHIIIHRLAFLFAMPPCNTADQLSVHRVCNIWKNGISWISLDGVNVLVEFSNSNKLTVLLRSKRNCELNLVKLRSKIISTVLKAKKEYCPKIDVDEFFARNDSLSYPLKNDIELVNMLEIAKSIVKCQKYCYCNGNPNVVIEIAALLHFEPFSNLGCDLLHQIFSKRECEVTDQVLTGIFDQVHSKSDAFIEILEISFSSLEIELTGAPQGVTHKLLYALKLWRNKEHSYSSLCTRLSQYSLFAGRNPLEVAGVLFETDTCLSEDPTTNSATIPKSEEAQSVASPTVSNPTVVSRECVVELNPPPSVSKPSIVSEEGAATPSHPELQRGGAMRPFLILKDLVRKTGVRKSQLDSQINQQDLHKLADCFDNIETYLDSLELTAGQQTDIKDLAHRRDTKTAMVEALKLWQQPNPYAATFRALLEILLDLKRGDIAIQVCQYITNKA